MLKNNIESIFRDYLASRNETFADHPLGALLRHDFPKDIESLTDSPEKYKFTGSAGQGNWTYSPWVGIFNKKITESAQSGYYIVYLFREDMKGVYLSLNQGMTNIRNQTSNNSETKKILKSQALEFRKKLKDQLSSQFLEDIDLGVKYSPNAPFYEAGNIYAKYYSADDLPSEDVLETDYKEILGLYDSLVDYINPLILIETPHEIQQAQNKFLDILYNNADEIISTEKIIFPREKTTKVKAHWSNNIGIWVVNRELDIGNRYFNAFGIEKPDNKNIPLISEINIPKEGIDRKVAGGFAKDSEGNVYVIHRGKIGGKSRIDFLDKYTGELSLIQDGNQKTKVAIIGSLNDPKLPEKVRDFVLNVARLKVNGNLKEYIEKILKYYHKARKEKFYGHSMAKHIKEEFPQYLSHITPNSSKYIIKGYAGQSGVGPNWTCCPSIKILDTAIGNNFNSGPFVIYIFSNDAKKVFLSLNQPIQKPSDTDYSAEEWMQKLKNQSSPLRKKLNLKGFELEKLQLESHETYYKRYEVANICAKCYNLDNLPSEEELITDYLDILNLYNDLITEHPSEPLFSSFNEYYTQKGFYFSSELVENFLLSLKVKPFVILTGNSGTGKTKIAQLFAEYLKLRINSQHKLVPVGANWTENRHLLGFYNIITKDYQKTAALSLIIGATDNVKSPYFLVLDEMNLSHVERYFADFLSAMESEESIPLHSNNDTNIPWELNIPKNLLVIGTVNVDETTYMFSPKVLDRANTIEFLPYPAKNYILDEYEDDGLKGNVQYLEDPLSDLETRNYKINDIRKLMKTVKIPGNYLLWEYLADEIQKFQDVLRKAGFEFGFRVINEILRFMYVAWVYEDSPDLWKNWERYFDAQIKQKMLPKLHGSQRVLEDVLKDLFELCYTEAVEPAPRYFENLKTDSNVRYKSSALKIQEMDKVLNEQRYVSFIN